MDTKEHNPRCYSHRQSKQFVHKERTSRDTGYIRDAARVRGLSRPQCRWNTILLRSKVILSGRELTKNKRKNARRTCTKLRRFRRTRLDWIYARKGMKLPVNSMQATNETRVNNLLCGCFWYVAFGIVVIIGGGENGGNTVLDSQTWLQTYLNEISTCISK